MQDDDQGFHDAVTGPVRTWHCDVCGYLNDVGYDTCQECGSRPVSPPTIRE